MGCRGVSWHCHGIAMGYHSGAMVVLWHRDMKPPMPMGVHGISSAFVTFHELSRTGMGFYGNAMATPWGFTATTTMACHENVHGIAMNTSHGSATWDPPWHWTVPVTSPWSPRVLRWERHHRRTPDVTPMWVTVSVAWWSMPFATHESSWKTCKSNIPTAAHKAVPLGRARLECVPWRGPRNGPCGVAMAML